MAVTKRSAGIFASLFFFIAMGVTQAQGLRGGVQDNAQANIPVDGIAAVVGSSVVTVLEVDQRAKVIAGEMRNSGRPMPAEDELKKQALDTHLLMNSIRRILQHTRICLI